MKKEAEDKEAAMKKEAKDKQAAMKKEAEDKEAAMKKEAEDKFDDEILDMSKFLDVEINIPNISSYH